MKILKIVVWTFVCCILFGACTTVKRYKSASYKGEDHGLVDMDLYGASLDPSGRDQERKSLWDLSASAQTQMIQILHGRYPDNSQFTGALNREYLHGGTEPVLDFTRSDLRMVFTVFKVQDHSSMGNPSEHFSPADRIESLSIILELPEEPGLRFTGWNRYITEYGEVEIAEMSFTSSIEIDLQAEGEEGEGGLKRSTSRSEEQVLKSRYVKLNGNISDRKLEIREEGVRGIDLTGNVIADVSLEFEKFPERITVPLFSGGDVPLVSTLKFVDVLVPRIEDAPESLRAKLRMDYIYRHVESGEKTWQEWDDKVAYFKGVVEKEVELFSKADYTPTFYCIGTMDERIRVRVPSGDEFPLQFFNYGEASRFLEWLKTGDEFERPVKAGKYVLLFGETALFPDSAGDLVVMPVY